jgi:hypothetical protein
LTFVGLAFPEERYAILLTNNFLSGGIGKIAVRNQVAGVTYGLATASNIVTIDSSNGHLTLLVNADSQHRPFLIAEQRQGRFITV